MEEKRELFDPVARDSHYGSPMKNVAQYLLEQHDVQRRGVVRFGLHHVLQDPGLRELLQNVRGDRVHEVLALGDTASRRPGLDH